VTGTIACSGATATFTPTSVLASNTTYTATITTGVTNGTGAALAINFVWSFTTTAPVLTVISTIPTNGATGVVTGQVLAATFNQAVKCSTVTTSTFTVTGPGGAVAGTIGCSGASATFTPTSVLASNTAYTATITTGVTNGTGVALASNFVWSFTTATSPLTVTSTIPTNGATGVLIDQVLTATFSQAVNCSTVTTSTFTATGPGGAVTGTIACSGATATFTPTSVLASNTTYTATITTGVTNGTGVALAINFVWSFTTTAPVLTVTSTIPTNGATGVLADQVLAATFSQAVKCSTVTTSTFTVTGLGGAVAGTIGCSGASATFTPTSVLASNTIYTATITTGVTNGAGVALASNFVWSFATTLSPTVISTSPLNNATGVALNTTITATFSQAMNCSTVTTLTFILTGPAGAIGGIIGCAGTSATFTPTSNLASNTTYTATITTGVTNEGGTALAHNYVWSFKTGPGSVIAPTVISTNPANNATGVPINQKITATFSEAMDATTITSATFTLTGPGGVAVIGTVTYVVTGSIATFAPNAALAPLTTYVATITTGATDLAGDPLGSNYVWTFNTGVVPDTTKPTVISTIPANGVGGVPINQAVSATFSEAMDPATINLTTFTLVGPGGTAVPGLVTYAGIANTATFTPTANLLPNTLYTATVTTGATDLAGNPLGAGIVPNPWSFTTAATVVTTPPTITLTSPINASTNVPVTTTVNATFSEAMDPLTITAATFDLSGPGGAVVTGTVAYDPINFIATFTPSSNLAANTTYAAEVATGATDLAGNPLGPGIAPNPWSFTTAAVVPPPPPAIDLGTASTFGGFGGGAGMTNQGILTVINGDIGTTGVSTTMTGFHDAGPGCTYTETPLNIGAVNGEIYTAPPPPTVGCPTEGTAATMAIASQAAADALTAYNTLAAQPGGPDPGAGQLGGLVLAPGTYTSAAGTFLITGSDLTLDAKGNANAVWIFQMASSLTVGAAGAPRSVILVNGAQAKNVFWQVGTAATINGAGGGTMVGTIIAKAGITFSTAGNLAITTLNGRALGLNASVTMVNTVINVPGP
jgi:hypothetical protein